VGALNSAYSSVDGVLFDKSQTTLIQFPGGKAGSYTIPNSVTNIGGAFAGCTSLTAITVGALNSAYSSVDGVLFDKSQTTLIRCPEGKAGSFTVPNTVTGIEVGFDNCTRLTSITIPNSLALIGNAQFHGCTSLTGVYFQGNAPSFYAWQRALGNEDGTTVYYLPGSKGWRTTFDGLPTALWLPQVQTGDSNFGVWADQFGFTIRWTSGMTVVVEASTSLTNPSWVPLETHTFRGDSWFFSDPDWANYPSRFYRIRSP
jgi:hypothetical protein